MTTRTRAATTALTLLAALAVSGCELPDLSAGTSSTAAEPTDLSGLTVAPEDTGAPYDRDDWPHWTSTGEGCDSRDEALKTQGRDVSVGEDCELSGSWTSVYDGETVTDPSELDVDHLVPLAEAARSGARDWSEAEREAYANDPDLLVAVTASSNRSKGDQDPATWLPERDRCTYVTRWVQTKQRYALTVDQAEAEAIRGVLTHCEGSK
ncbi:HNH endonuclease family protein [Saccharomonospora sp. NPDC006951]